MIDPNNINTIRVGQLVEAVFSGTDNIPHEVGTDLRRGTIADLASYIAGVIDAGEGLAFLPIAVTDGQTLPSTTTNEWFLAGEGTYSQTGGFADIVCTEKLNVIIGNGTSWSLGVEIPIEVDPPAAMISQTVTEGVTNFSPSEDAVFNAINDRVFLQAAGSFHYSDLATQTTPLNATANVELKITNDTLGTYTDTSNAPFGVSSLYNPATNQFDFSQLEIGDMVHFRPDLIVDLVGTNTSFALYLRMGIGSVAEYDLEIATSERKSTDAFNKTAFIGFDISNEFWRDEPAEFYFKSDANATVKVNGYYFEVIRKNVNIVNLPDIYTKVETDALLKIDTGVDSSITTVNFGGIPAGTDIQDRLVTSLLIDAMIVYLYPQFTSQACNYPSIVEVGTTVSGSGVFTWAISNGTNIVPNSVNIFDVNANDYLVTGLADDGSQTVTLNSQLLNTNNATQVWKISAENTKSEVVESSNITTTAKFKRFFGATSATPTTGTARSLGSEFQSANAQTFTLNTGSTLTKFAVCLPSGVTISSVIDLDALNLNITANYISLGTININDIGGTSRIYNLYEMNIGAPYSSNHRHQITTI